MKYQLKFICFDNNNAFGGEFSTKVKPKKIFDDEKKAIEVACEFHGVLQKNKKVDLTKPTTIMIFINDRDGIDCMFVNRGYRKFNGDDEIFDVAVKVSPFSIMEGKNYHDLLKEIKELGGCKCAEHKPVSENKPDSRVLN